MAPQYGLNAITGAGLGLEMDMETFLGAMLIAAWAAVVLRGLERGKEGTQMGAGLSCRPECPLHIRRRNGAVHQE